MRTAGTSRQSALALTGIYQKERFCLKDFFKTSSFKVLAIAVVVLLGLIIYTATAGALCWQAFWALSPLPCRA